MKIVLLHYHLKTGGVTTVLKQQVEALKNDCEILVLSGSTSETPLQADTVIVKDLGYDKPSQSSPDPEKVADAVVSAIKTKFKSGSDLIHVHNPTLAKNRSFLKLLKSLKNRGLNIFLQIHDFAEDGRPDVYTKEEYVSDCHYGVINSRDYKLLLKSGLHPKGLHRIFNSVTPFDTIHSDRKSENIVLYPVRAIRRKNVGEAILLSLFFNNNEKLAITLPPNSPSDMKSYVGWKTFVNEKSLDVTFDAGLNQDFTELVASSKYLITTSINEGFGFSFLEPWIAGKIIWGRKLPDICNDFEMNHISLDHLYSKLIVPIDWIGRNIFYKSWKNAILKCCERFDCNIESKFIEKLFNHIISDHCIDFGLLHETYQKQIIEYVLGRKNSAKEMIRLNPYLSSPAFVSNPGKLIQRNTNSILQNYSLTNTRHTLLQIYHNVIHTPIKQKIDKKKLLSSFLNLERFSLLKWDEYYE